MSDTSDDEDLAIRMIYGDREALREVLKLYLEPVKQLLAGIYGNTVQQADLDEAVNAAIYTMWTKAGRYEKSKATLRAWFFTIAQNKVIDIFRRERRYRRRHLLLPEDSDMADDCDTESNEELTDRDNKELKELEHVIEHKLKGLQQSIIKADLAVGGTADAASLAEMYNTSKDTIYVSRHKAHENIRKELTQLARNPEKLRGRK